jgi:hypothetical protein
MYHDVLVIPQRTKSLAFQLGWDSVVDFNSRYEKLIQSQPNLGNFDVHFLLPNGSDGA